MAFRPNAGDTFSIDGAAYRIAEHPAAPHMAYGQEGRAGIVYQVRAADGAFSALKAFKPRHRIPTLVRLADQLEEFADLPGMQVCRRTVLTPQKHTSLLQQEPDLTYAVLMPWIAGPTWMQVMFEGRILTSDESLGLARALSEILAELEQLRSVGGNPAHLLCAAQVGARSSVTDRGLFRRPGRARWLAGAALGSQCAGCHRAQRPDANERRRFVCPHRSWPRTRPQSSMPAFWKTASDIQSTSLYRVASIALVFPQQCPTLLSKGLEGDSSSAH